MIDLDPVTPLDRLEDEIASMRERIGRYRRAMLASRIAVVGGLSTLVVVYVFVPSLGSGTVVLTALACAIGGVVWLGATKSSSDELAAALQRAEDEKEAFFDDVAARNGWSGPSFPRRPSGTARERGWR